MEPITELLRLDAPCPRPQALAFDGTSLWIGSIETNRLYAVDPNAWTLRDEIQLPGKPWGMTVAGDEFRVVLGAPETDDRSIVRVIAGHGVHPDGAIACPDGSGSHLAYDGDRLYLSQWYKQQIVALEDDGTVTSTIALPHQICGVVVAAGRFYCLTTDDEDSHTYFITRVDARHPKPEIVDIATVDFDARALAFDGERFWTNHREANQTVAFALALSETPRPREPA
jgi:sugar lactone lactonase YvrE